MSVLTSLSQSISLSPFLPVLSDLLYYFQVNHSLASSMHLLLAYGSSDSEEETTPAAPVNITPSPFTKNAMPQDSKLQSTPPTEDSGKLHTSQDVSSQPRAPQGSSGLPDPALSSSKPQLIEIDVVGGYRHMAGYDSDTEDSEEDSDSSSSSSSSFTSSSSSSSTSSSSSSSSSLKKLQKVPQTPR